MEISEREFPDSLEIFYQENDESKLKAFKTFYKIISKKEVTIAPEFLKRFANILWRTLLEKRHSIVFSLSTIQLVQSLCIREESLKIFSILNVDSAILQNIETFVAGKLNKDLNTHDIIGNFRPFNQNWILSNPYLVKLKTDEMKVFSQSLRILLELWKINPKIHNWHEFKLLKYLCYHIVAYTGELSEIAYEFLIKILLDEKVHISLLHEILEEMIYWSEAKKLVGNVYSHSLFQRIYLNLRRKVDHKREFLEESLYISFVIFKNLKTIELLLEYNKGYPVWTKNSCLTSCLEASFKIIFFQDNSRDVKMLCLKWITITLSDWNNARKLNLAPILDKLLIKLAEQSENDMNKILWILFRYYPIKRKFIKKMDSNKYLKNTWTNKMFDVTSKCKQNDINLLIAFAILADLELTNLVESKPQLMQWLPLLSRYLENETLPSSICIQILRIVGEISINSFYNSCLTESDLIYKIIMLLFKPKIKLDKHFLSIYIHTCTCLMSSAPTRDFLQSHYEKLKFLFQFTFSKNNTVRRQAKLFTSTIQFYGGLLNQEYIFYRFITLNRLKLKSLC